MAGTRRWEDYGWFRASLADYLVKNHKGEHIAFIGGKARSGADAMLERWVLGTPFDYYGFEARWDELGKRAGFARNSEMALEGTHLLAYWDQKSRGTRDMINQAQERGLTVHVVDISAPQRVVSNCPMR